MKFKFIEWSSNPRIIFPNFGFKIGKVKIHIKTSWPSFLLDSHREKAACSSILSISIKAFLPLPPPIPSSNQLPGWLVLSSHVSGNNSSSLLWVSWKLINMYFACSKITRQEYLKKLYTCSKKPSPANIAFFTNNVVQTETS